MTNIKLGIVMDPIETINPAKDSSLAMLLAAQQKTWEIHYMQQHDLYFCGTTVFARTKKLEVMDNLGSWFRYGSSQTIELSSLDIILMRKDPPFDMEYIYTTYMLEHAEAKGTLVVNRPASLRDVNEKFSTTWFPQYSPPTLVSKNRQDYLDFLAKHGDIIIKPLDGMGGASIFRITKDSPNVNVILETLLDHGKITAMAQLFLPDYIKGDKRILLINGKPVDYALARIPAKGETRANLAAGATGIGVPLTTRDREICTAIAPELIRRGLIFVGIDIIGDYLTEINVTSPTCIRELDKQYHLNIGTDLMTELETMIS